MMYLPLLAALFLPFMLFGIYYHQNYAGPKRLLKKITDRYPELVHGATPYQVGYFSRDDLGQQSHTRASMASVAVLSSRQRTGYLFVKDTATTFITLGPEAQWSVQIFTPSDSHVTLFDHVGVSIGLPSYIRFSNAEASFYVTPKTPSGSGQHQIAKLLFQALSRSFPTLPLGDQPARVHRPGNLALGIAGVALAALITLWVMYFGRPLDPFKYLAVMPDQSILVVGDTHLVRLSPDGETRLQERALADLGFVDGPMGLQVEPQGTILMGDRHHKTIVRCNPSTWQCQPLAGLDPAGPLFRGAFTFAIDPDAPRLWVDDIERNRILALDLNGRLTRTILENDTLCAPQHIGVRNGRLIVVNTQHHSIQSYTLSDPPRLVDEWLTVQKRRSQLTCDPSPATIFRELAVQFLQPNRDTSAKPFAGSASSRVWPTLAAQDARGAWWVANASKQLYWADVLRFETPAAVPTLVLSGRDRDPVAILPREHDVLIADLANIEIVRFDLEGNDLGRFGDRALETPRRAYHERERRVYWVFLGGLGGFFILMLTLAGILMRVTERRMQWLAEQDTILQT